MGKIILKFGFFSGLMLIGLVFLIATLCEREVVTLDNSELVGYTGMLVALTMVFFGIKTYRSENVSLSFWKGLQVGLGITAVAAVMYFLGGELYNLINPDFGPTFMRKYADHQVELMRGRGSTDAQIETMRQKMASFLEMYKNPLVRFGVALVEFVPVGLIVSLISAALLRRRKEGLT